MCKSSLKMSKPGRLNLHFSPTSEWSDIVKENEMYTESCELNYFMVFWFVNVFSVNLHQHKRNIASLYVIGFSKCIKCLKCLLKYIGWWKVKSLPFLPCNYGVIEKQLKSYIKISIFFIMINWDLFCPHRMWSNLNIRTYLTGSHLPRSSKPWKWINL